RRAPPSSLWLRSIPPAQGGYGWRRTSPWGSQRWPSRPRLPATRAAASSGYRRRETHPERAARSPHSHAHNRPTSVVSLPCPFPKSWHILCLCSLASPGFDQDLRVTLGRAEVGKRLGHPFDADLAGDQRLGGNLAVGDVA